MSDIQPGDVVTIGDGSVVYHVKTMSQNGMFAFLRQGWPENPGKHYKTEATATLKKVKVKGK